MAAVYPFKAVVGKIRQPKTHEAPRRTIDERLERLRAVRPELAEDIEAIIDGLCSRNGVGQ
jgi:DNA-binding TFAR19-related protein (PDSD5 family)